MESSQPVEMGLPTPASKQGAWTTCSEANCPGVAWAYSEPCLAHLPTDELHNALSYFRQCGNLDVRGVTIDEQLFRKILASSSGPEEDDETVIDNASFDGAIFNAVADFSGVRFYGRTSFQNACFKSTVRFDKATFCEDTLFIETRFEGPASFSRTNFDGSAFFVKTAFLENVDFQEARFTNSANFPQTTFGRDARFSKTNFENLALFSKATFCAEADFDGSRFSGETHFYATVFERSGQFRFSHFAKTRQLGPLLAGDGLTLDESVFVQPVAIEVSAATLICKRVRFLGGVQFRLRWTRVIFDETDFSLSSVVAGHPNISDEGLVEREQLLSLGWVDLYGEEISERPKIHSLRRANVSALELTDVDASECRFFGAYHLDKLRIESDVLFAVTPRRGVTERREVVAEERDWRASNDKNWKAPYWLDGTNSIPTSITPSQIASVYRSLRKGREDAKNESGASSFYFGEMEMRRKANGRFGKGVSAFADRAVLTAYWLISGYGLRAWRSFVSFVVLVTVCGFAFRHVGLHGEYNSFIDAWLFSLRSAFSMTNGETSLTAWGQVTQLIVRVAGPILLGLTFLAFRNRVKR